MCLRPSGPPQDPEKHAAPMNNYNASFIARWMSRIFSRHSSPSVATGEDIPPWDYPNENVFPGAFAGGDRLEYSEGESQQASAKLWSFYVDEALRYDSTLVDSWRADMEGMLIFSGLFSASLTAFLIESYRTLQADSGDMTVQLLLQISQQLGGTNSSVLFNGASTFEPTTSSLVCNTMWFISLSLSITCALLATLVEQWAREFLHRTEKRPSPIRHGRIFSFLYFGIRRFGMHAAVDLIPMLLHISMILFLVGLIAFLLPINRAMMGIIIAVLSVFLVVYVVLTILPIVSFDCPYRTPFSDLVWNVLRIIKEHVGSLQPPASSAAAAAAASINDAMVRMALNHPEIRDRRAFLWTLESLTDDNELLPFLEAIPEAIHGAKGFHLVNDHLFIPLLDAPIDGLALGQRIGDLLLRVRNMVVADPRRQPAFVAGMKAVWALGMISGRTGPMFKHSGQLWFDTRIRDAFRDLDKGSNADANSYSEGAWIAICYSRANNVRHALLGLPENFPEHSEVVERVNDILNKERNIGLVERSQTYQSHVASLAAWSNNFSLTDNTEAASNLRIILDSLTKDTIWLEINVTILCQLLVRAAHSLSAGGRLPYEFLQTCIKIVPLPVSTIARLMRRPWLLSSETLKYFDPSRHKTAPGQISDLDWIIRCLLRIVPLVRPEDLVPIVAQYIDKRNDVDALVFTTRECRLPILLDSLVSALQAIPVSEHAPVLHSIFTVLTLRDFAPDLCAWQDCDERFYNYVVENNILRSTSFQSLSAVVIHRILNHISISAQSVESDPKEATDKAGIIFQRLKTLACHPILCAELPNGFVQSMFTADQLINRICTQWVPRAAVLALTDYINACVQPHQPRSMADTMSAISVCLPRSFEAVDTPVMREFAQASASLVDHVAKNPDDSDLKAATSKILSWFSRKPCPAQTAHLFGEVLTSFLNFLESQTERDEVQIALGKKRLEKWSSMQRFTNIAYV